MNCTTGGSFIVFVHGRPEGREWRGRHFLLGFLLAAELGGGIYKDDDA